MKAEKTVILEKYRNNMPRPANMQKLLRASKEEVHPKKKAIAFVKEVIVIEAPA